MSAQPSEAAQDKGDVRAEDAVVSVGFVHYEQLQIGQHLHASEPKLRNAFPPLPLASPTLPTPLLALLSSSYRNLPLPLLFRTPQGVKSRGLKYLCPLAVVRQQGGVEQIRVGQEDMTASAQLAPIRLRRVAIERGGQQRGACVLSESREVLELVLSKCFRGEEKHCARKQRIEGGRRE